MDLRIHDINVVADLNQSNPNSPSSTNTINNDGTFEGRTERSENPIGIDFRELIEEVVRLFVTYWTGPWPVCHIIFSYTPFGSAIVYLHMTVDLLFNVEIADDSHASMIYAIADKMGIPDGDVPRIMEQSIDTVERQLFGPGGTSTVFWILQFVLRWSMTAIGFLAVTPQTYAVFAASLALWVGTVALAMGLLLTDVANRIIHPFVASVHLWYYGWTAIGGSPFPFLKLYSSAQEAALMGGSNLEKMVNAYTTNEDLFDRLSPNGENRYRAQKMAIWSLLGALGVGLASILVSMLLALAYENCWDYWQI